MPTEQNYNTIMGLIWSRLAGLFNTPSPMKVLMLGLGGSGKTAILYRLHLDEVVVTIPTNGFNVETVTTKKGHKLTVWDIGYRPKLIPLRKHYYPETKGVLYVIDSVAKWQFEEAYEELTHLIENDDMRGVPIVVLANKQDLPNAAGCEEIAEALHLNKLTDRQWHVQPTCGTSAEGLHEALNILGTFSEKFIAGQDT